jgi:hypothetical protein
VVDQYQPTGGDGTGGSGRADVVGQEVRETRLAARQGAQFRGDADLEWTMGAAQVGHQFRDESAQGAAGSEQEGDQVKRPLTTGEGAAQIGFEGVRRSAVQSSGGDLIRMQE